MGSSENEIALKPRVLIADDSRIVRATLIKQIQGIFEFAEAVDGEQAWEKLLLDPHIKVVITDLTMPKLDGYGLLGRIRASKISRISKMPVVVVSGSDEQEERARAKAAGATDLINKGIATAQLLSRLDILSKLVNTQHEYEQSLEVLVHKDDNSAGLASPYDLQNRAESLLAHAVSQNTNFVLLNVSLRLLDAEGKAKSKTDILPLPVLNAIGQLLQGTIRQTDCVAKTGDVTFTVVTSSINLESARNFAERLGRAITGANLLEDESVEMVASCGLVSLCEYKDELPDRIPTLNALWDIAQKRSNLGTGRGLSVVTAREESENL
jgi:two-component system, cell cycle response regulator